MQQVLKVDDRSRDGVFGVASALLIFGESVRFLGHANAMALSLELTQELRTIQAELSVMGPEFAIRASVAQVERSAVIAAIDEGIARVRDCQHPFAACIERAAANENFYKQWMRKMVEEF